MGHEDARPQITYRDAGVDTAEGARSVESIRAAVRSTYRPEVIGDIGGFGGMFSASAFKDMDEPVLVSGTDGVGTKLVLARMLGMHDTVGIDLVAMCANDIAVTGAEALFFLDYIAIGKLDSALVSSVVSGIAEGCRQAGCSLIGGEMAEHPGIMADDEYDLSGFCVGVVERSLMVDGSRVASGDVVLGIASSGLHSNGFSLVRRALVDVVGLEGLAERPDDLGGLSVGEALLTPTRIYGPVVRSVLDAGVPVNAIAHITGGGITENLDRVLPSGCDALVDPDSWDVPPIIGRVVEAAGLSREEALRTFNMGIGLAFVCAAEHADALRDALESQGERVFTIGEIVDGTGAVRYR